MSSALGLKGESLLIAGIGASGQEGSLDLQSWNGVITRESLCLRRLGILWKFMTMRTSVVLRQRAKA